MSLDGSVVIALDGSPHSAQTLEWGMSEATLRRADVLLVRASPDTLDINRLGWYPLLEDQLFETEARDYLTATLAHARERWPGVDVSSRLVLGQEVPVLRDVSRGAGLLVVGARGRSGRRRLGSTGSHVASHAHCPVAVVRAPVGAADADAPVVVGVDGSASSLGAAEVAADEAVLRGAPLVVVHARPTRLGPYGDPERPAPGTDPQDGADDAPGSVDEVAQALVRARPGLQVTVDERFDDPPAALLEVGADAQLVVVGSRGLGAFRGLLLGSVSSEVLRQAQRPVLVVRSGADDAGHG